MATYVCRVGLPDGAVETRTIEAADEGALRAEIARLNARLFSARATAGAPKGFSAARTSLPGFASRKAVKPAEFLVFNQELVALLKAGLPIVAGFEILLERQENPRFRRILATSASSSSRASRSRTRSSPTATSSRASTRRRSRRASARARSRRSSAASSRTRRSSGRCGGRSRARSSIPAVLIGLSLGLITILMTYVIPRFSEFFAGFEAGACRSSRAS